MVSLVSEQFDSHERAKIERNFFPASFVPLGAFLMPATYIPSPGPLSHDVLFSVDVTSIFFSHENFLRI